MADPISGMASLASEQAMAFAKNIQMLGESGFKAVAGNLQNAVIALAQFAPHNVLGMLAKGAGTFSATTPTSTLNQANIF